MTATGRSLGKRGKPVPTVPTFGDYLRVSTCKAVAANLSGSSYSNAQCASHYCSRDSKSESVTLSDNLIGSAVKAVREVGGPNLSVGKSARLSVGHSGGQEPRHLVRTPLGLEELVPTGSNAGHLKGQPDDTYDTQKIENGILVTDDPDKPFRV